MLLKVAYDDPIPVLVKILWCGGQCDMFIIYGVVLI